MTVLESNSAFCVEREGDTLILTPLINLRELEYQRIESGGQLVLEQLASEQAKNLVVDFHKTDSYGSTALGFFVRLWQRVQRRGGRLAFCNVSPQERETLHLSKLDTLWRIHPSRDDALADVRGV